MAYNKHIIPAMEDIARKDPERGTCDVIFHEQEDGAGYHNDRKYNKSKDVEFEKRKFLKRKQKQ